MIAKNGIKIRIEYSDGWEEKLAKALFDLHMRIEKKKDETA